MKLFVAGVDERGMSHVESVTETTASPAYLWSGDLGDVHEIIHRIAPNTAASEVEPGAGGVQWIFNIKQPDTDPLAGYGMHVTRTIDFDFVIDGQVDCILDAETVSLEDGDAIILKAANHRWWNPGPGPTTMLLLMHQPLPTSET